MSVYTVITHDELVAFLGSYALGGLTGYEGISDGIENTNYFVTTSEGEFVLTIFEAHTRKELSYFLDLMAFLAEHEVPSAHPIADRNGGYLQTLKNKPAALVQRLRGASIRDPNRAQCRALGSALGHLHAAGRSFAGRHADTRGARWWRETADRLMPHLEALDRRLLEEEIAYQTAANVGSLPRGVIHADLFRDNALWEGDHLAGIIDFYYACDGPLLYDLGVTVNDWCSRADGSLDDGRVSALLEGYRGERPFEAEETAGWPVMLRAAALRFWLSRLQDKHFPREGEITHIKDPDVFRRILVSRVEFPPDLDSV